MAERAEEQFAWSTLVAVTAPFVVAGVWASITVEDAGIGQVLWQAVVLWPIGGVLLIGPVAISVVVRNRALQLAALVGIAIAGAVAAVMVASSDDAQAGIGFLVAPVAGVLIAAIAVGLDRTLTAR